MKRDSQTYINYKQIKNRSKNIWWIPKFECYYDKIPTTLFIEQIIHNLNGIYEDEEKRFRWHFLSNSKESIILGFGHYSNTKKDMAKDIQVGEIEVLSYQHLGGLDIVAINKKFIEKYCFAESDKISSKIFEDLKKAGF
jgi:hypothetical protein